MTYCEQNEGYRIETSTRVYFLPKSDGWTQDKISMLEDIVWSIEIYYSRDDDEDEDF